MLHAVFDLSIPLLIGFALWGCSVAGARFAKRVKVRQDDLPSIGVVQGAMLGLLALLLGFSFSGAMVRFSARQDLLVQEANAVGTAWLRADILPEEDRSKLRTALQRYTDVRIELFQARSTGRQEEIAATVTGAFSDCWAVAAECARRQPELAILILPPVNDVSDLLAAQNAAHNRHIPTLILVVLLACACGSVAAVGFGLVFVDRRTQLPAVVLVALITGALWLIVDMDYPRLGMIRVSGQPLIDLRDGLK